jgi:hypothetical protein
MTKMLSCLRRLTRLSAIALAAIVLNTSTASAQSLGSAQSFAILGGPAVTCTTSTVTGDVGVVLSTGLTNTGCTIVGMVHQGDPAAARAYADFLSAYNALGASPPCTAMLTGTLAGVTLPPGVYCFAAAAALTGTVFLDARFDRNALWIFRVNGALTATNFDVVMINEGRPCNVSWWVKDAATLTDSNFQGTTLAGAAITITRGTFFNGHALAKAAVTLTDTKLSACSAGNGGMPPPVDKCKGDDDEDDHDKDGDHHDKDGDHDDKDRDHHDKDKDRHDRDKGKERKDGDRRDKDHESRYMRRR